MTITEVICYGGALAIDLVVLALGLLMFSTPRTAGADVRHHAPGRGQRPNVDLILARGVMWMPPARDISAQPIAAIEAAPAPAPVPEPEAAPVVVEPDTVEFPAVPVYADPLTGPLPAALLGAQLADQLGDQLIDPLVDELPADHTQLDARLADELTDELLRIDTEPTILIGRMQ